MNIELIRDYCLSKKGVTEAFPFDKETLVFKVMGKMFALTSLKNWEEGVAAINLKCDPEKALELRAEYDSIEPGWHMSKKHWNTLRLWKGELDYSFVNKLIDHSYDLVAAKLSKKDKELLNNL